MDCERKAEEVKRWIVQFANGKATKSAFAVYGPPGSGKSFQMKQIARGYDTVYLDSSCIEKKDLFSAIEEAGNYTFPGLTKLVIVDDFDVITGSDKNEKLKRFLKERKNRTPLVLVCDQNTKRLKDYNTVCEFLKFEKVSREDARVLAEKLSPYKDSQTLEELAEYTQGDIRNLVQMVDQLRQPQTIAKLSKVFTKKDQDPSLYEIVNTIPNRKLTYSEAGRYFDLERVLVPFLVHENYTDWIQQSTPRGSAAPEKSIEACSKIMEYLSDFDVIETNVYLHPNFNIEGCTLSLSGLGINGPNKTVLDYKTQVSKGAPKEIRYTPARFTNMISKLASKKARETLVLNLHSRYGQMEKDMILLLRNKIFQLIRGKTSSGIKLAVDILLAYELNPSVVDSLMRMFVFKGSVQEKEFGYTAKMKELLAKEYALQKEEMQRKQQRRINIFR